jgi:hypothetical protein
MSICALMVAASLAGAVDRALSPDTGGALESLLAGLQRTISTLADHGGQSSALWRVPALPSGSAVRLSFSGAGVLATADGVTRVAEPVPELHLWRWDGSPLNETRVEDLDRSCQSIDRWSGDTVSIDGVLVPVDDCAKLLLFAA